MRFFGLFGSLGHFGLKEIQHHKLLYSSTTLQTSDYSRTVSRIHAEFCANRYIDSLLFCGRASHSQLVCRISEPSTLWNPATLSEACNFDTQPKKQLAESGIESIYKIIYNPHMLHVWNIYLHLACNLWINWNVGKYSSPMEHMGKATTRSIRLEAWMLQQRCWMDDTG